MKLSVKLTQVIHSLAVASLVTGGLPAAWARQPLSQAGAPPMSIVATPFPDNHLHGALVSAAVRKIDPNTGLVDLDTGQEKFYAVVPPEDVHKLHEGDVIIVYVENSGQPTLKA
ncbi:MAG TPA: hypothetical protein VNN62_16005 [Methylomirabilota bacterium]|jgi:hypothetical protein|nr:hypothetical protein [Methylomirabilota bacterium]